MARIICLAWLALALWAQASVTAGWKVPSSQVVYSLGDDPNVPKLENPPGESAFFQSGDELWDLSQIVSHRIFMEGGELGVIPDWPGEWVVWNARSGMVVARGSESDLLLVQGALELPQLEYELRAKLELVAGGEKIARSISQIIQSGIEASAKSGDLELKLLPTSSSSSSWIDLTIDTKWTENGVSWEYTSTLLIPDGRRVRIASHASNGEQWELFLTITQELPDGTKRSETRCREASGGLENWPLPAGWKESAREPFHHGLQLGVLQIDDWEVPADLIEKSLQGTNPDGIAKIAAPAELARWIKGDCHDLTPFFREQGVPLDRTGTKVIFDPGWQRVIVLGSEEDLELVEFLFGIDRNISQDDTGRDCLWIELSQSEKIWGLACRSGSTAKLSGKGGTEGNSLELEPILGGSGRIAGLAYCLGLSSGSSELLSKTILILDVPQNLGGFMLPGQAEEEIEVTLKTLFP
ncbi:hypothetical protein OJ996_07765 [Luteolibacter sp. GHJ8]|uniref:Uncharacterized protein n=1 Tax=Luteolibacter rhizosphaerae TaxID=2989719 RepID=A0ABT3G0U3_9BACT|nr:hypothetical protein [Luteolibacter rhizosphaerae]MCW1913465.1 hypothetical protein [Luteolibacter rhizosphaerae]